MRKISVFLIATYCNLLQCNNCDVIERIPSMGSIFEMQFATKCGEKYSDLLLWVKNRLDSLERSMSLYQKNSDISRLNSTGEITNIPNEFIDLVHLAIEHSEKTEGYFNIAVFPVLKLIQDSFDKTSKPPKLEALDALKPLLDLKNIKIEKNNIRFLKKGMMVTLDGIAKGFAIDLIAAEMLNRKLVNYLLNFSGNMRLSGTHANGDAWKISIHDPFHDSAVPIDSPIINGNSIASSGIDINYYSEDKRWHHLINPKILRPSAGIIGASVIGPSATTCDALSKIFVMGVDEAKKILPRNYPEYKYWLVTSHGKIFSNF